MKTVSRYFWLYEIRRKDRYIEFIDECFLGADYCCVIFSKLFEIDDDIKIYIASTEQLSFPFTGLSKFRPIYPKRGERISLKKDSSNASDFAVWSVGNVTNSLRSKYTGYIISMSEVFEKWSKDE